MTAVHGRTAAEPAWHDLAAGFFDALRASTRDGAGVTRECYAPSEDVGVDLCRGIAQQAGLKCAVDAAANLVVSRPEDDGSAAALILASHIDSIPQGGNYDGAAGVLAALLCLMRLHHRNIRTHAPVRAMVLRGEESAFYGRSSIGSRALFGALDAGDLQSRWRDHGRTLAEALSAAGADVGRIEKREPLLDAARVCAYLELHIEQGPVMVARQFPTAIVSGIRGNLRHVKVVCRGEAGHSGAVPRPYRQDAVFAVSDLVMRIDGHWSRLLERGLDLVATVGKIETDRKRYAISRIPGEVEFGFEIRSQSDDALQEMYALFRSECRAVGLQRKVAFELDECVYTAPAKMDPRIVRQLLRASERLNLPGEVLASGAGHDAAVFAKAGIPTGMIFVRNANGSHNPDEAMDLPDFIRGVELMFAFASGDDWGPDAQYS